MSGHLFYKYSVVYDKNRESYANATTETMARKIIINAGGCNGEMWVRNNESGLLIGIVSKYNHYGIIEYTYETTDGRERRINADGTFAKKTKKKEWHPFGL